MVVWFDSVGFGWLIFFLRGEIKEKTLTLNMNGTPIKNAGRFTVSATAFSSLLVLSCCAQLPAKRVFVEICEKVVTCV